MHVWSDGAASQYKSKLPLLHISRAFDSNFSITWNFFGSRHGKSAADGEAAVVQTLTRQSAMQDLVLDNAEQVYNHLVMSELHIVDGLSRRHFYFVEGSAIDVWRRRKF